jgi:nucleoside-triphosphatase THEP1
VSIFILSGPVHSGKTTGLQNWMRKQGNVHGLLMPEEEEGRFFEFFPDGIRFPAFFREGKEKGKMEIGRFVFSENSFAKANDFLLRKAGEKPDLMVADELGKLEMENKGLATGFLALIAAYKIGPGSLILVIRESLLEPAIEKFGLKGSIRISGFF